jgi:hypothetical protein
MKSLVLGRCTYHEFTQEYEVTYTYVYARQYVCIMPRLVVFVVVVKFILKVNLVVIVLSGQELGDLLEGARINLPPSSLQP